MMSCGMSGNVCDRVPEKREMQGLNDRLAMYMKNLHDLKRQGSGAIDPAKYQEALGLLENELHKLKAMYESELDKLRRQLDDANCQKNNLAGNLDRQGGTFNEMSIKLQTAEGALRKLQDECNNLRCALANKEKDIADLCAQLKCKDAELDSMRPNYGRMNSSIESLRGRLEAEQRARQDAEDKLKQLMDKRKFDGDLKNQENQDLQQRLKVANDICQKLEQKIRQLAQGGGDELSRLLQKLRDANMAELKRYQSETEDLLNKNLGTLRGTMSEYEREKERLARERAQLEEVIRDLQKRIAALEGENQGLRQQVATLSRGLDEEKSRAAGTIRDLEGKRRDLENTMMNQTKDFVTAREAQACLKTEINQYRNLLDLGQQKLTEPCPPTPCVATGGYQATSGYHSIGGNRATGCCASVGGCQAIGGCKGNPAAFVTPRPGSSKFVCAPPPRPSTSGPRYMCGGGGGQQVQRVSTGYKPGGFYGITEYTDKYRNLNKSHGGFPTLAGQNGYNTSFGGRQSSQRVYNY